MGAFALYSNPGSGNSALGSEALRNLTSGSDNIAVGAGAGDLTTAGSGNIYVGNAGAEESDTIRIGATQTATFIAGISGAASPSGVAVFVDGNGQLGTTTSSRRYKEEISDVGGESDVLLRLRPVAFRYRPELDESRTRQYGLVAEEVANVAPQLVVKDATGAPQTVRYHFVNAMLLNELQKQRRVVEEQGARIRELERRLARLEGPAER